MLIFGMQVDGDLLYHGIESQPSAYSGLYLSNFLSFHTLMEFSVKDFSTMQTRVLIFGMQVDDVLYRDLDPASSCLFVPVYVHFSFFPYFEEIFRQRFLNNHEKTEEIKKEPTLPTLKTSFPGTWYILTPNPSPCSELTGIMFG